MNIKNSNYWTVQKLIEELNKFPKDMNVCAESFFLIDSLLPINKIELSKHCVVLKQI